MRCFQILNDVIFRRFFEKKNSMFFKMFEKFSNIVLTMHINDVFGNTSFSVSESQLRETNNLSQISKDLLQFSISLKLLPNTSLICIVSTMFQLCLNMVKTSRSIFSSKHRLKIASLRIWKHRIIKKSEHCPPLLMQSSQLVTKDNNQTREGMRAGETIAQEG